MINLNVYQYIFTSYKSNFIDKFNCLSAPFVKYYKLKMLIYLALSNCHDRLKCLPLDVTFLSLKKYAFKNFKIRCFCMPHGKIMM